jgi:hypothetical protein
VPQYRAYPVNADPRVGKPRIAAPPHIVECDTDQQAIAQARQFVNGCDIEIGEGARFVMALKSTDKK